MGSAEFLYFGGVAFYGRNGVQVLGVLLLQSINTKYTIEEEEKTVQRSFFCSDLFL